MHRIALKAALVAMLLVGGLGLPIAWSTGIGLGYPLLSMGIVGLGMFLFVRRQVTARLERVYRTLNAMRPEGSYDGDPAADGASGDEIDRLIRRGDQVQVAIRKHIADLSHAESYRREYVGDVSHEIKTPVFAIQGFAETLLAGALEDDRVNRGFVQKILRHAVGLSALAKDLGEISRLEMGVMQPKRTPFHVGRVFDNARDFLEHLIREKDIDLQIVVDPLAVWVNGDQDQIHQIVVNLVDNAIKYNNAGGRVRITSRREGTHARISVKDDGIGIAEQDLSRVTERFFRVDKSRSRAQGGTGLGLSIVKHILVAHDANLEIRSTPGSGSTFSFVLPVVERFSIPDV